MRGKVSDEGIGSSCDGAATSEVSIQECEAVMEIKLQNASDDSARHPCAVNQAACQQADSDEKRCSKRSQVQEVNTDSQGNLESETWGKKPILMFHQACLFVLVAVLNLIVALLFSGLTGIPYAVYFVLVDNEAMWYPVAGCLVLLALALHLLEWYSWPTDYLKQKLLKAFLGVVLGYLFAITVILSAKKYPGAPLIVVFLHFPIAFGLFRYWRRECDSSHFYTVLAAVCMLVSILVLIVWVVWLMQEDLQWNSDTKWWLQNKLGDVHKAYGLIGTRHGLQFDKGWARCLYEQELTKDPDPDQDVLDSCVRVGQLGYLIWICPLIQAGVLIVIGLFSLMRVWMTNGSKSAERSLKHILFILAFFLTCFWIATATAGASMDLSTLFLFMLGASGLVFCIWLVLAVDISKILNSATKSVLFKIAGPALQGDWAAALVLCFSHAAILLFLALEVCTWKIQTMCMGKLNPSDDFITKRGKFVLELIEKRHWASILEKSFQWCCLFLVFFLFSKATPVFLSWLRDVLNELPFVAVVLLFYAVGLTMFLLPPVPGVPVYMAAGVIIVARAKSSDWPFWPAVFFASVLGLVLKMSAVLLQQKCIGEMFGRSLYIQQLVGVHTSSIRAIEEILKRPGLTLSKVCILCGGPDWPTSVLTGILGLSLLQMELGTLPCYFLIVPCTIAGASSLEASLASMSAILVLLVGVTQGGAMLGALIFIAKEAEASHEILSKPKPEHAELIKKAEEAAKTAEKYKHDTKWIKLSRAEKIFLVSAVGVELVSCGACLLVGSACFRQFEIGNEIGWRIADGGLDNNVANLATPLGRVVMLAVIVGLILYTLYIKVAARRLKNDAIDLVP